MFKSISAMAIFTVALVVLPVSGKAQPQPDDIVEYDETVKYKKKTHVSFSDHDVEGQLVRPAGAFYMARKRTMFKSLIQTRQHFLPELVQSLDSL